MRLVLVDNKRHTLLKVKVEISKNMFIVAPELVKGELLYLTKRIMNIRHIRMMEYLFYCEYNNADEGVNDLEKAVYNEIKDMLNYEIHRLNEEEGIHYYLIEN